MSGKRKLGAGLLEGIRAIKRGEGIRRTLELPSDVRLSARKPD